MDTIVIRRAIYVICFVIPIIIIGLIINGKNRTDSNQIFNDFMDIGVEQSFSMDVSLMDQFHEISAIHDISNLAALEEIQRVVRISEMGGGKTAGFLDHNLVIEIRIDGEEKYKTIFFMDDNSEILYLTIRDIDDFSVGSRLVNRPNNDPIRIFEKIEYILRQ